MFVKIYESYRNVVAVCDEDLIGKILEEGKFCLEVKESFFKGKSVSEKETAEILEDLSKEDATFNIVGKNSVNAALNAGIISEEGIKTINGIPFALVLM